MSNSIYLKNFRKFQEFPQVKFGDITFLVGKNNSGKSTIVKAILLVYNYLISKDISLFQFNQHGFEDVNIVTYGRAFNNLSRNEGFKDDFLLNHIYFSISFSTPSDNIDFSVQITGEDDNINGHVLYLNINQHKSDFVVSMEPSHKRINLIEKANSNLVDLQRTHESLEKKVISIKESLNSIDDKLSREYIQLNNELEKISKNVEGIKYEIDNTDIMGLQTDFSTFYNSDHLFGAFDNAYSNFIETYKIFEAVDISSNKVEEDEEEEFVEENIDPQTYYASYDTTNIDIFNKNKEAIRKNFDDILAFIDNLEIIYLPATLNKHSSLFAIKDGKNSLAQTIHEYFQLGIKNDDSIKSFIKKWLQTFEVGIDIEIDLIEGEAYTANLIQDNNKMSLADAGMGVIQATLLLLRLASVIHKKIRLKREIIVILEEPELNLHPALQSKLCDLFFEIYEKYKVKFIIETHSEYIIRRSQVITAKKEFDADDKDVNPNPFSALYFPSKEDEKVYSLNYQPDGTFENSFGSGFFDESSASTLELIKLKRLKNK